MINCNNEFWVRPKMYYWLYCWTCIDTNRNCYHIRLLNKKLTVDMTSNKDMRTEIYYVFDAYANYKSDLNSLIKSQHNFNITATNSNSHWSITLERQWTILMRPIIKSSAYENCSFRMNYVDGWHVRCQMSLLLINRRTTQTIELILKSAA